MWECVRAGKCVTATGFELDLDEPAFQHHLDQPGLQPLQARELSHSKAGRTSKGASRGSKDAWANEEEQEDQGGSPVLVRGARGPSLKRAAGGQRVLTAAVGLREDGAADAEADGGARPRSSLPWEADVDKVPRHARQALPPSAADVPRHKEAAQGKAEGVSAHARERARVSTRPSDRDAGAMAEGGGRRGGGRVAAQVPCKNGDKGNKGGEGACLGGAVNAAVCGGPRAAVADKHGLSARGANDGAASDGAAHECSHAGRRGAVGVFDGFTFLLCEGAGMSARPSVHTAVSAGCRAAAVGKERGAETHGNGGGCGLSSHSSCGSGIPGLRQVIERAGGCVVAGQRAPGARAACARCPTCSRCPPVDYEVFPVWPLSPAYLGEQGCEHEQRGVEGEDLDRVALAACQRCKVLEGKDARGAETCKTGGGVTGTVQVSEFWVRKCAALGERVAVASLRLHLPYSLPQVEDKLAPLRGLHVCLSGVHGQEKRFYKWLITQVQPTIPKPSQCVPRTWHGCGIPVACVWRIPCHARVTPTPRPRHAPERGRRWGQDLRKYAI